MKGATLEHILKTDACTSKWFQTFSSPDLPIPKPEKTPALFVLNTDKSTGPGEHWCLFILNDEKFGEFFDPLGLSPVFYGFEKPLLKVCANIKYNEYAVQNPKNATCGHHCIYYAINRSRGKNPKAVMKTYSEDLQKNDIMVFEYIYFKYGEAFAQNERSQLY